MKSLRINRILGLGLAALTLVGVTYRLIEARGKHESQAHFFDALRSGKIEDVRYWLRQGVDIRARDESGWDALLIAIISRDPEIVELLLKQGADPNSRDAYSNPAILNAAQLGEPKSIRLLIQHGADVSLENSGGQTAIDAAPVGTDNHATIKQALSGRQPR